MTPLALPGINRHSQWHQEMLVQLHQILLCLRDAPDQESYAPRDEGVPGDVAAVKKKTLDERSEEETEIAEIEEALRRLRIGTFG